MTPAEKAGQLTQYFYFRLPAGRDRRPGPGARRRSEQPREVEAALARGEAGSLLFVTDPAEINRLQRLAVEGNRLGIPLLFGFDVIHGLRTIFPVPIAMAASWDPDVIERGPGGRRPGGAGGRHPLGVRADGRHRPGPALGPDGRGRGGGPVPGRGRRGRAGARLPGRPRSDAEASSPGRSTSPATAPRSAAATTTRWTCPTHELWNVYFPPFRAAVEAGAGNIMTAYMDLNGVPASGSRLAVHRRAAGDVGLRRLRGERRQRRTQSGDPRLRRRPRRRRGPRA